MPAVPVRYCRQSGRAIWRLQHGTCTTLMLQVLEVVVSPSPAACAVVVLMANFRVTESPGSFPMSM